MRYQTQTAPRRPHCTVRPAEPTDQFACIALDASYRADYAWLVQRLETGDELTVRIRPTRLPRQRVALPDRDTAEFLRLWQGARPFLVAERGDDILGWLAAWPEPDPGVLRLVECAVAPAERRHGVGRELVSACVEHARSLGARWLRAVVSTYNDPAIRFLMATGWLRSGWDEGDGLGVPQLIFTRRL